MKLICPSTLFNKALPICEQLGRAGPLRLEPAVPMKHILTAFLILAWASTALGQTYIQSSSNQGNGTSISTTFAGTVAAGDIVIIACWGDSVGLGALCTTTPTVNNSVTESWTSPSGCTIQDSQGPHGGYTQQCSYVLSAVGGWTVATCHFASPGDFNDGCLAIELSGCTGCNTVTTNKVVNNTASTTMLGATITPTASGGIVVSSIVAENQLGVLASVATPFLMPSQAKTSDAGIAYTLSPTSGTLLSPSFTSSGSNQSSSWTISIMPPAPPPGRKCFIGGGFCPQ